jgi:dTDP-glucose pyrophosphorylase/transcriptional regulator with XRE-family HTH domain
MPPPVTSFGDLLRQTREAVGLSRADLGEQSGLDVSHIYRMEVGGRRPSRESALALADVLGIRGEQLDRWLSVAGYAPMPLMDTVRTAVRTRGSVRPSAVRPGSQSEQDGSAWKRLSALGLDENRLDRLLRAIESTDATEPHRVARLVSSALARLSDMVESPIRTAVVPAAGGQHRLIAGHLMQRLLLRAVREVAEAGLTNVVLILPPGMNDTLYTPLKDALDMSIVPAISLAHQTQTAPHGLGDAILQAEADVGHEPFAVVLPDDVLDMSGRAGRGAALPAMIKALAHVDRGHLIAVMSSLKTRMTRSGVAVLGTKEVAPRVFPVKDLVEKPASGDAIFRQPAVRVVGRYLLQPDIFKALHRMRAKNPKHVELTDALAESRRNGLGVFALELDAPRHDLGDLFEQADALLGPDPA